MTDKPSDWVEWRKWLSALLGRVNAHDTYEPTVIEIDAAAAQLMDWNHRSIPPNAPRVWCIVEADGKTPLANSASAEHYTIEGYTVRAYALVPVEDADGE